MFGSNTEGRHGTGAALYAKLHCGAIQFQPKGLQGNSYAIVTKDLSKGKRSVSLGSIRMQVLNLIEFAKKNPLFKFRVSPIGCGLAGFQPIEIAPMFKDIPKNIDLPDEFYSILNPRV